MKITGLTTRLIELDPTPRYGEHPIPPGRPMQWQFPLVIVHTDAGIDGYSMAYGPHGDGPSLAHNLHAVYAPEVIGEDPLQTERLWHKLMAKGRHLYTMTDSLASVLDVAFWDIKGKSAGLPVATLIGGERTSIPTYATGWQFLPTADQVIQEACRCRDLGYHGYKLQLWQGVEHDIELLRAARAAVGQTFNLMQDANSGYSFLQALAVGRVLDELNFLWFEEPIADRQLSLTIELSRQLKTPILPAETVRWAECGEFLRHGRFGMMRGDVHLKGGITGLCKLFCACEALGMDVEIHTAAVPLLDVANLHVACAFRNCRFMEHHHPIFRFGLKNGPLEIDAQGYMHLPAAPGLGIEPDWDWLDRHSGQETKTT
jgi:L-alanine-DL-glutamate epimerase-like enolase superfamily enzyme